MFTSRFKFLVASLTVAIAANSFADTGGQSTIGTPITGLYDALGNSLTTAISLTGASYTITYNDVNNLPNQWVFSLPSGTLTTTIKLHFTASGWKGIHNSVGRDPDCELRLLWQRDRSKL